MKKLPFYLLILGASMIASQAASRAETGTVFTNTTAYIAPLLELAISQTGQSELRFGNIRPSAIDTTQVGPITLLIDVKSNTGDRYQVIQTINSALENSEGDKIDLSNLRFKTSSIKSNGIAIASPTPVSASSQIVFTSDAQGTSDTISAEYTLTVPASQAPGDYSALLTYTVSSL